MCRKKPVAAMYHLWWSWLVQHGSGTFADLARLWCTQEAVAVKQLPGEERAQQPQQPQQPPGQQQDGGAAAGSGNAAAAREPPPRPTYVPPQQRQQAQQQEQNVFGFAKLRREGAPAPPPPTSDEPAEGRGREAAAAGGGRDGAGAAEGTAAPAAAAGIDAETKRRVEEALRALKRQGKEKRESKEKKRGRKEKSKKKERHRCVCDGEGWEGVAGVGWGGDRANMAGGIGGMGLVVVGSMGGCRAAGLGWHARTLPERGLACSVLSHGAQVRTTAGSRQRVCPGGA